MYRCVINIYKKHSNCLLLRNAQLLTQSKPIRNVHRSYNRESNLSSYSFQSADTSACKKWTRYLSQQVFPIQDNNKGGESSNINVISEKNEHLPTEDSLFENIDFDSITEGNEETLNRFKLLLLEVEVLRQDGMHVPSKISTEDWKELLFKETRSQRLRFLKFLWKTEVKKKADQRRRERKRLAKLNELKEKEEIEHIRYGFQGNTIFVRIYDTTINFYDNHRLVQAMLFGQNLVIDCGFENEMTSMENRLCVKQLIYLFGENRLDREPFNLHFCSMKKDGYTYQLMKKGIPTLEDPAFPINIHNEHYLELFPKERLVYLTPHCRTELKEYNNNDIYILGGIVDRQNNQPLTLAKAKSEGLRMAHLPLDRYLDWSLGTKSLTVNQVLKILLDMKRTGDWKEALINNVPKRKIRNADEPVKDHRKFPMRGTYFQPPRNIQFKKS